MNNLNAKNYLRSCNTELKQIKSTIKSIEITEPQVKFLTNYTVIKCCGTIEFCFKTIISDIHSDQSEQIKTYIDKTIRDSSMNPTIKNIYTILKKFDTNWHSEFKNTLNLKINKERLRYSLDSLNTLRNTFAHGGSINQSFNTIERYYYDSIVFLQIMDEIVKN